MPRDGENKQQSEAVIMLNNKGRDEGSDLNCIIMFFVTIWCDLLSEKITGVVVVATISLSICLISTKVLLFSLFWGVRYMVFFIYITCNKKLHARLTRLQDTFFSFFLRITSELYKSYNKSLYSEHRATLAFVLILST